MFYSAFERAKSCLVNKEYKEILPLCDEELSDETSKHTGECLLLRGTFRLLQGMGITALEDLEKIIEMEGLSPKVIIRCRVALMKFVDGW